jgi:hypothetical protein
LVPTSNNKSISHASFDDILQLRAPGRTLGFINFPAHSNHEAQVRELHEDLQIEAGATRSVTLRTSVQVPSVASSPPSLRWFTVVDPDIELVARTYAFAEALLSTPGVKVRSRNGAA